MKKKILLIILFIILSGVFASNFGGPIPYLLFYFSMIIPISSLIYIIIVCWNFKYFQEVEDNNLIKMQPCNYTFSLRNDDRFMYCSIYPKFYKENSKILCEDIEKEYAVLPKESNKINTKICCKYRGEYYIGIKYIIISDYLNLFHYNYKLHSKLKVIVMPRLIDLGHKNFIYDEIDEKVTNNKAGLDELDVFVNRYQKGDSLKQINFKVSARQGKLYKRPYKAVMKTGIVILVDLKDINIFDKSKLEYEDALIEQSLSVINYCFNRNLKISVIFYDKTIKFFDINSKKDFEYIYMIFAKIRFNKKYSLMSLLSSNYIQSNNFSQIVAVTGTLSKDIYVPLKKINAKKSVILINTNQNYDKKNDIKTFESENIDIRIVNADENRGAEK